MLRLVALVLLGACGFQINGGAAAQDAGGIDGGMSDGSVDAVPIDAPLDDAGHPTDWWNPEWTHRRRIKLDTSTLTGPVTDFPVLVRLPALTGPQVNGADLRFVSLDGTTTYPYELEAFNALAASPVWIKMSLSNAADTELFVYYGNPVAAAESNGAAVFASNHVSVHHLGSFNDATGNGHGASNGSTGATPTTNLAGRIGAARTFDGNNDHVVLANSNGPYDFTNSMYASAWVRVEGFEDQYQAIITKGDSSWRLARAASTNAVGFGWTNGGTNHNVNGDISIADGEWHHVAIVMTPTAKYVFVDGVQDEVVQSNALLDNNEYSVRIGANEQSNDSDRNWHGDIDEVRISSTSRDAAWIYAEYRSVDATFAAVGADEAY